MGNPPRVALPTGSIVRFRSPSLWVDHRREVLAIAAGLLLQSLLIVGLLYQRRERQRAEVRAAATSPSPPTPIAA